MLQKLKSRKGNHVDNNVAYYKKKRSNTNIPTFMTSQSPTKVNVMVSSDRIHHPFKTNAFPNLDHAKNISGGFGDIFKIGELEQFRDEFINISKNNRTQVFNPSTFKRIKIKTKSSQLHQGQIHNFFDILKVTRSSHRKDIKDPFSIDSTED